MRDFLLFLLAASSLAAQGELHFDIRSDPRTLNPLLAADVNSETVAYLVGGVLIRVNRLTQQAEPALAESWKVAADNRSIAFRLRKGVLFSDGSPFTAEDVAATIRTVMAPDFHSPVADSFHGTGKVGVAVTAPDQVTVTFEQPVPNMDKLFDQLAILPAKGDSKAVLGPFQISQYQPGAELLLKRNPNFWKRDAQGRKLPYLDTVRLSIQQNREMEATRFRRGELQLVNQMDPELFERLVKETPAAARDAGPSTDVDFFWFNLVPGSPIPGYKKAWFASRNFRQAVSLAVHRDDLIRVIYKGFGKPSTGIFSPANQFWFNTKLTPVAVDVPAGLRLLEADGFRKKGATLFDKQGNPVEFSLVTNSGNKVRERMAVLIQQDLLTLGIKLNIVTLDFPSLLERLTRNFQYETCLLGLSNVGLDPDELMNVLLSSGAQHAWNPSQKTPATPWEGEIDRLMRLQANTVDKAKRKAAFDRVQEILREESPYVFLAHRNSLSAIAPRLRGAKPAALFPQAFWNIEELSIP